MASVNLKPYLISYSTESSYYSPILSKIICDRFVKIQVKQSISNFVRPSSLKIRFEERVKKIKVTVN